MTTSAAAATAAPAAPLPDRRLRLALKLDAVVTGLNGVAYLTAASLLDDLLGLPAGLLRAVGVFLSGYAVAVWLVGTRPVVSARAAGIVIAVNLLWAVDSLAAATFGWGTPTTTGTGWIALQAVVVGAFGVLQWLGLRHRRPF